MKKMMYAIGLGLLSGSLWAACVNSHYCADDTGASIDGVTIGALTTTGAVTLSSTTMQLKNLTITQINASTATYLGQPVWCNNCTAAGGAGTVCFATSTVNQTGFVLSTGTVCK